MVEALVQKLLNDKDKGLTISFKTDGKNYFAYTGGTRFATMNKKTFDKVYGQWKTATALLAV